MKRWLPVAAIAVSLTVPRLAGADTLTVAVAANLQYVFDDLRAVFQRYGYLLP